MDRTSLEEKILEIVQDDFPLQDRPYRVLSERVSRELNETVSEIEVFETVDNLRASGLIRRMGGVYDSKKMGYTSRLCCGIVGDGLEQFAGTVLGIPCITHNYVRSHKYNVWFTVIGKSEDEIRLVVADLEKRTSLRDSHVLGSKKLYKINTVMKSTSSRKMQNVDDFEVTCRLTPEHERVRVSMLAGDLPWSLEPFADMAYEISRRTETEFESVDLINSIKNDIQEKRMRRFGAILRHQQAGFVENAMVCFKIGEDVEKAGELLAQENFVSHCYERETFEGFEYNLYAMMHAKSSAELEEKIKLLAKKLSNPDYAVLISLQELKKTSFNFDNL